MKCVIGQEPVLKAGSIMDTINGNADSVHTCVGLVCKNHIKDVNSAVVRAMGEIYATREKPPEGFNVQGRANKLAKIRLNLGKSPDQKLIAELHRLKSGYKDGIPDEIKHSVSKDSGWKVQRGVWFQTVANAFTIILERQLKGETLLSKGLCGELLIYFNLLTSPDNPLKHRPTRQLDINEAEAMIDRVLAELENHQV